MPHCVKCGADNDIGANSCANCGAPMSSDEAGQPRRSRATQPRSSSSFLLPKVVLGVAPVLAWAVIYLPSFFESPTRSRVVGVMADLRNLATGLEAYFVDNGAYPPWAPGDKAANGLLGQGPAYEIPTRRVRTALPSADNGNSFRMLTTPVAYVESLLIDRFAEEKGTTYGYYAKGSGWVLFSAGPDLDYDLTLEALEEYYDPTVPQPTPQFLVRFTYDPTNGTGSNGDIYRLKQ